MPGTLLYAFSDCAADGDYETTEDVARLRAPPFRSVLFFGPPGGGKTHQVRQMAGRRIYVRPSQIEGAREMPRAASPTRRTPLPGGGEIRERGDLPPPGIDHYDGEEVVVWEGCELPRDGEAARALIAHCRALGTVSRFAATSQSCVPPEGADAVFDDVHLCLERIIEC